MDVAVCTMMVGDDEAVVRNDAAGAAEIQGQDGILQGSPFGICIVYLVRIELQALGFHVGFQCLGDGIYHPHTLIRKRGEGAEQQSREQRCDTEKSAGSHGRDYLPATASISTRAPMGSAATW